MKKKDLEIILQKLPPHPSPVVKLEQYPTPANIAADILFTAFLEEDIAEKVVMDLGCGTGIFAIGAKLLSAEQVVAVDVDGTALAVAEDYANLLSLDIKFIEQEISAFDPKPITAGQVDTIIQNPPFGAQKSVRGADRVFIEKALAWGKIVYSLHLSKTEEFVELLVDKVGGSVLWKKKYAFPISHMFFFHTKNKVDYEVTLFKIQT